MRKYTTVKYDRRTPQCQVIYALQPAPEAPPPFYIDITGTVTDAQFGGTGFAVPIEFTGLGTVFSDASTGSYGLSVLSTYVGVATPYWFGGTFSPTSRSYSSPQTDQTSQDYAFWGTTPQYTVEGTVLYEGVTPMPGIGAAVTINGVTGTEFTDENGVISFVTYRGYAVDVLYLPPYAGTFDPATYSFSSLFQNENVDTSFVPERFTISGTYGNGGAGGLDDFLVTNGTGTWYASNSGGSYGFDVTAGWSGSITSIQYITPEGYHSFTNVQTDQPNNNFLLVEPFVAIAASDMNWVSWSAYPLAAPDRWFINAQNPDDLSYSTIGTVAGSISNFDTAPNYGTLYNIYGVNADSQFQTLVSNDVLSEPPDVFVTLEGSVFSARYGGTGIVANLFSDVTGTFSTNGSGYWTQTLPAPLTTAFYVVDVTGGTYSPAFYSYVGQLVNLTGQDFAFWDETPLYTLGGTVYDGVTVLGLSGVAVEVNGGTIFTASNGSYGFTLYRGEPYSVIAHDASGTFDPSSYSGIAEADTNNLDFYFYGPSGDCPIPAGLMSITDLPTPNAVSRSVNDPINNLLWYLDDSFDFVYYVDAIAGTFAGSVVMPAGFGQASIVYEPLSHRVVVMDWSGSIHVINPDTKVSTRVPDIDMVDPGFHMLAINDTGTVYATDNRQGVTGSVWAINPATATLIKTTKLPVFTDSICWASNINKLFINSGGSGQPAFYLFDPLTDVFEASTLLNPAVSFRYENFYIPSLGHVLESFSGGQPSAVIDISQGTAATQIATIEPTRVSNATIDTCNDRLFVADGNFAIWEFSLDGSYTLINRNEGECGLGISPNSLSHNRATNLVYYADFSNGSIYTVQATRQSGSLGIDQCVIVNTNPDFSGGMADSHAGSVWWSGSAVGEDSTPFNSFNFTSYGALANIDTAYAAQVLVVFTGSIADSGTIDIPSSWSINLTLDSYSTNFSVNGTNGFVSGTVILDGTIDYGFTGNAFGVNVQATNGGNFTVAPCNTFVQTTGTAYFTPLTPP